MHRGWKFGDLAYLSGGGGTAKPPHYTVIKDLKLFWFPVVTEKCPFRFYPMIYQFLTPPT